MTIENTKLENVVQKVEKQLYDTDIKSMVSGNTMFLYQQIKENLVKHGFSNEDAWYISLNSNFTINDFVEKEDLSESAERMVDSLVDVYNEMVGQIDDTEFAKQMIYTMSLSLEI